MLSRFHLIPERYGQTDGRTDRQRDRIAISISRVSVLTVTGDKTSLQQCNIFRFMADAPGELPPSATQF